MDKFKPMKEKGTYFEGSEKKYPNVGLPKWMQEVMIEEES